MTGPKSLVSTDDLTLAGLHAIVERGALFAANRAPWSAEMTPPLAGKIAGMYFAMTSTRTRTAFSSAALRLGAQIIGFGPGDLQTNTGESLPDTGRVLGGMLDVLVARIDSPQHVLAGWAAELPVVNAMAAEEHPTQALSDLSTLRRRLGRIEGLRVLYIGEGNNTAAALALTLSRFPGVELELRTPPGYGLAPEVLARARTHAGRCGALVRERHDMAELPDEVDVVYTTRWQTTGTSKPDPQWRSVFEPFRVTTKLWESSPNALFMHDLPAHRGDEVTAEVLDGPASIAFEQAAMKASSAMAVLEWCLMSSDTNA